MTSSPLFSGSPVSLGKRKRRSESPEHVTSVPGHRPFLRDHDDQPRILQADGQNGVSPTFSDPMQFQDGLCVPKSKEIMDLPLEIVQHIFSFADPISLGRLMCVNRLFHNLLDPAMPLPLPTFPEESKGLRLRNQNLIWTISRKTFFSGFPRPMDDMTELDMWKLVRGKSCNFCNKRSASLQSSNNASPWNSGPGRDGVRAIWPFRVRACAQCLESRLIKDTKLLVSSTVASTLRAGLPFAIFTDDWNYILSTSLQHAEPPPQLQLIKFFFQSQIEQLQEKLSQVQGLGPAATEEWYKGLEDRGRLLNADAARFEQCELQGVFKRLSRPGIASLKAPVASSTFSQADYVQPNEAPGIEISHFQLPAHSPDHPMTGNPHAATFKGVTDSSIVILPQTGNPTAIGPTSVTLHNHDQPSVKPTRAPNRNKQGRSLQDVEWTKAERRTEIERRCQALVPPISASILSHMDAFQASIKIARPLTDDDWRILEPRLLAQRLDAQHKETVEAAANCDSATQLLEFQRLHEEQRVAQENESHMWAELNKPSRDRLAEIARKFIQQTWSDGRGVTRATSSTFAAEVLYHVRLRFQDEIIEEDKMLTMKGTALPHTVDYLANRRLKLDDMKWTFEEFVRPHTDKHGKDLFLCRVCDNSQKLFSFEAVIQHYAAKHTNSFTRGNAVVSWKAEWPLEPPFDPSPNIPWVHSAVDDVAHSRPHIPTDNPWMASRMSVPRSTGSQEVASQELVLMIKDIWQHTDGVWNLPDSLRFYIVMQVAGRRFAQRFNDDLGFHMFLDCIRNRPELYLLNSLTGLHCKICASRSELVNLGVANHHGSSGLSVTALMTHFQKVHIDSDGSSSSHGYGLVSPAWTTSTNSARIEWKRDMVLLPKDSEIKLILNSPATDPIKLQLIREALSVPAAISTYLPGPRSVHSVSEGIRSPHSRHSNYGGRQQIVSGQAGNIRPFRNHYGALVEPSVHPSEGDYDAHHQDPRLHEVLAVPSTGHVSQPTTFLYNHMPYDSAEQVGRPYAIDGVKYHDVRYPRNGEIDGSHIRPRPASGAERATRIVHSRPASVASSRHRQSLHISAEHPPHSSPREAQYTSSSGAGTSTAAVDFLNNFDPMEANNVDESDSAGVLEGGPSEKHNAYNSTRGVWIVDPLQDANHLARSGTRAGEEYYPRNIRHSPSLPIRQQIPRSEWPVDVSRAEVPSSLHQETLFGQREAATFNRSYALRLPERLHKSDVDSTREYHTGTRYYLPQRDSSYRAEVFDLGQRQIETIERGGPRYEERVDEMTSDEPRHLGPLDRYPRPGYFEYEARPEARVRYIALDTHRYEMISPEDGPYSSPSKTGRIAYANYDEARYNRDAELDTKEDTHARSRSYRHKPDEAMDQEQHYSRQ